jgi:ribonuclease D
VLLERITAALATPEESWPRLEPRRGTRPDRDTEERLERLKRYRNDRARDLGIEPGVLCPNGTLEAIARTGGTSAELDAIPELRAWQRAALGEAPLVAALSNPAPGSGGA